jgi:hypothetical protein
VSSIYDFLIHNCCGISVAEILECRGFGVNGSGALRLEFHVHCVKEHQMVVVPLE